MSTTTNGDFLPSRLIPNACEGSSLLAMSRGIEAALALRLYDEEPVNPYPADSRLADYWNAAHEHALRTTR